MSQVLQARTVRKLAPLAVVEAVRGVEPEHRPTGTVIPLTAIQEWFFDQDFADPGHLDQARVFEVVSDAETAVVPSALGQVVARHDSFRTRFGRRGAVLTDEPTVAVDRVDVPDEASVAALTAEAQRSLRLDAGPLGRFTLFERTGGGRRWLAVVLHHLPGAAPRAAPPVSTC